VNVHIVKQAGFSAIPSSLKMESESASPHYLKPLLTAEGTISKEIPLFFPPGKKLPFSDKNCQTRHINHPPTNTVQLGE
jgi:hypothetical protein